MRYEKILLAIPLLLLLCILSLTVVSGGVVNLNGGDFNDVQNGVNTAGSNGILNLGNHNYYGSGNQIVISNIDDLIIQGDSNSSRATLDANLLSEIFQVRSSSSQIRHCKFTGCDKIGSPFFKFNQ